MKSLVLGLLIAYAGFVQAQTPTCIKRGQTLQVDNQQILDFKTSTPNQYHDRGHIFGTIKTIYPDHTGHHHFGVLIGPAATDTIEVIYNEDFGGIPANVHVGSQIEACGDYITATQASNGYPASPEGAIIHWVHRSPNVHHDPGFMVIDGSLCGWN